MAIATRQTTTGGTATVVFSFPTSIGAQTVLVRNDDGANAVYLGGSNVTAANGLKVLANTSVSLLLGCGDDLYGLAAAGSPVVMVLYRT